ncbi:MAG: hypothetical protein OSJ59_05765 [Lachnospiraceae bacterium]|nr:hypothetical protein [Lachnospiraceae bacterium]
MRKKYYAKIEMWEEQESILCDSLMDMLRVCGSIPLSIGCVGNSIASGYSKSDEMLPFFARTKLFQLKEDIRFYSFARVRRNEELNVLKWYNQNISHRKINTLLLDDLKAKVGRYACYTKRQEQTYRQIMHCTDLNFQECIQLKNNILIYFGLSGTFTDIFRKGNLTDKIKIFQSFRKDFEYLKMILTEIHMANPQIQVYVCGLPDVMGIGLTNQFDRYIKKAICAVPNAVYIRGVSRNVLSILNGQKELDYHYNKAEYLCQLCGIWEAVLQNYIPIKFKNDILIQLAQYSDEVELYDTTSKGNAEKVKEIISKCERDYKKLFIKYGFNMMQAKKDVWLHYNEKYLAYFGCTDREAVRYALFRSQ